MWSILAIRIQLSLWLACYLFPVVWKFVNCRSLTSLLKWKFRFWEVTRLWFDYNDCCMILSHTILGSNDGQRKSMGSGLLHTTGNGKKQLIMYSLGLRLRDGVRKTKFLATYSDQRCSSPFLVGIQRYVTTQRLVPAAFLPRGYYRAPMLCNTQCFGKHKLY